MGAKIPITTVMKKAGFMRKNVTLKGIMCASCW